MFYEIFREGNLILRDNELLSDLSWDNELMYTPTLSLTLPVTLIDYIKPYYEMKVHVNGKIFWGLIVGITINKEDETIDVDLNHIVHEWTFREISVNNAIKEKNINIIYQKEVSKTTKTTKENNKTYKAIEWYENHKGKVTYSMTNRLGPNSYDCSSALYTALVYAGIFSNGSMGTTATLAKDLKEKGFRVTKTPVKGDIFLWTAGTHGDSYGHTGMFTRTDRIIHCNAGANGISENKFGYTWATFYHLPAEKVVNEKTETKIEEVEPEVVDQLVNIYEDNNFAYPGWDIEFSKKAQKEKIDYVYSRQNKLDALTKTCELTEDIFWRVGFTGERFIEVSEFGEKKPYVLSIKPSGKTNIRIVTEPHIEYDFEDIINVATIYSAKSDSGMSSLTMREVYEDEDLQNEMFPVIILRPEVNNERDYSKYILQPKAIAPNNELEYAVLDLEGIAEAGGYLIESSFAFNDISPFAVDQENGKTTKITDKDRVLAAKQAYKAAIRKLKAARVKYSLEIVTEELPVDINVGDKVRLLYDNNLYILEACSNYMKKILSYDDIFYVTKISYEVDETGGEVDTITLAKELDLDREELNEK